MPGIDTEAGAFLTARKLPSLAWQLADERGRYREGIRLPLLNQLEFHVIFSAQSSRSKATDPRDKIFALLGISKDAEDLTKAGLIPDYSKSCDEVYTMAARAVIQTGNVDLPAFNQFPKVGNVPSWVPDWRAQVLLPCGGRSLETRFAASGSWKLKDTCVQTSNSGELTLEGCVVDHIEISKYPWRDELSSQFSQDQKAIYNLITSVGDFYEQSKAKYEETGEEIYKSRLDRSSSYFRVPIGDEIPDSKDLVNSPDKNPMDFQFEGHQNLIGYLKFPKEVLPGEAGRWYFGNLQLGGFRPYRKPFLSKKGYMGLCAGSIQEGDITVIFLGGKFPYIIRENDDGTFRLIGEAYVHGIMYGEFMERLWTLKSLFSRGRALKI
jgi:hypothetical protein